MAESDDVKTGLSYENKELGEVKIADEVVAVIAGLAATEVDGVNSMAGNITNELIAKLGMRNLSRGVKVEVNNKHVSIDLALNINYNATRLKAVISMFLDFTNSDTFLLSS